MSLRGEILRRPQIYVGSMTKRTQPLWVFEDEEMVYRPVTFVPGFYTVFDELLLYVSDYKQRDPSMDSVEVVIDAKKNLVSVLHTGNGIPQTIVEDNVDKTTGGRKFGTKLANIFSTRFTYEIADGEEHVKCILVYENNMGKEDKPQVTEYLGNKNWTRVTFSPDLARFNMEELEDDVVALMQKRVIDIAGCLGETVKVKLNGKEVQVNSFCDYVDLYLSSANKSRTDPLPRMYEKVNDRWEVCVSFSEARRFQQVSFVNSVATINGGTHVEYVTSQITNYIADKLTAATDTNTERKAKLVKHQLWVFVKALIDIPTFESQTLTLPQSSFGSKCELSEDILQDVYNTKLQYYQKTKDVMPASLQLEKLKLENQMRFIREVESGEIILNNRTKNEVVQDLIQRGFTRFPYQSRPVEAEPVDATIADLLQELKQRGFTPFPKVSRSGEDGGAVDATEESGLSSDTILEAFCAERGKTKEEVEDLVKHTPVFFWLME